MRILGRHAAAVKELDEALVRDEAQTSEAAEVAVQAEVARFTREKLPAIGELLAPSGAAEGWATWESFGLGGAWRGGGGDGAAEGGQGTHTPPEPREDGGVEPGVHVDVRGGGERHAAPREDTESLEGPLAVLLKAAMGVTSPEETHGRGIRQSSAEAAVEKISQVQTEIERVTALIGRLQASASTLSEGLAGGRGA